LLENVTQKWAAWGRFGSFFRDIRNKECNDPGMLRARIFEVGDIFQHFIVALRAPARSEKYTQCSPPFPGREKVAGWSGWILAVHAPNNTPALRRS
jgi:hypothetical protein